MDAHDSENNRQLEERMVNEGYFPHGATLFNEYSVNFPHVLNTMGFNTLGGPLFYINLMDNSALHGPIYNDSEQKDGEPCFAKVVGGLDVLRRIIEVPLMEDDSLAAPVYIVASRVLASEEWR